MKYFAILKDSFREANDSKVLYVLLALSALMIVFVGSLSFTPKKAEDTFRQFTSGAVFSALNEPEYTHRGMLWYTKQRPQIDLVQVDLLQGEADSPLSEYKLTVSYLENKGRVDPFNNHDVREEKGPVAHQFPPKIDDIPAPPLDPARQKAALEEKAREIADYRIRGKDAIFELFHKAEDLGLIKVLKIEADPRPDFQIGQQLQYTVTVKGTSRTNRLWANEMGILFGAFPGGGSSMLGDTIYIMADLVMWMGSLVAVLMAVIITSSFIPNMLRKGTIDLLLVKPLHRWALLIYKYIGGLTFIFLLAAFSMTGMWFVLGVRSGLWAYPILLIIPSLTFFFAILYAISTFVGVMTRSTIACILLTIAAWFLFFIVGFVHEKILQASAFEKQQGVAQGQRAADGAWGKTFAVMHMLTPRTRDLDRLNSLILYCSFVTGDLTDLERFNSDNAVWWESLLVSTVWIAIFLSVSCLWFSTRDY